MAILTTVLTAIFLLIGWIGNRLVNTMDKIQIDINQIKLTVQEVSTSHDDLKERVEKIENHIYK
ncbi:MAG: hypothetical protein A2W11_03090 [Ignavibacteria bacterium RBG_16_35_7]|nr:MAG: hypothetical protein A2W11_03090 [Ignavibacteria bacterium RBG_16_35_7]